MNIWKIFFGGLALTIFITLTGGIYTLSIIKSDFDTMVSESIRVVRETTHLSIKVWAQENEQYTRELAHDPEIVALTEKLLATNQSKEALLNHPAQKVLRKYLKSIISGHELRGFFIISHDMLNLASTRDSNTGVTNLTSIQTEFQRRVWNGETLISNPQKSDVPLKNQNGTLTEHYPTMFIGTPIHNSESEIIAIFMLRIDPTFKLREIVQSGRIGETGESYLINNKGYMLTKSRFEDELVRQGLIASEGDSTFNIKVQTPISNIKSQISNLSSITSVSNINVKGYTDYRGKEVVGAWSWDPHFMFGIVTEVDIDEKYIPYYRTQQIFVLFTTGAMLLFGIFSWLFVHIHTRMQASKKHADTLFENAGDPILIINNKSGNIISANKLALKLLKYEPHELIGFNMSSLRVGSTQEKVSSDLREINRKGFKLIETSYYDKNGKRIPVEVSAKLVPYGNTEVVLSIIRNITNRKNAEQLLLKQANTDFLTGIGNRTAFERETSELLKNQNDKLIMLMLIGIDGFRVINDTLGHITGDNVLKVISTRIANSLTATAGFYRFGGDEFVVVLEVTSEAETYHCKQLQKAINEPLLIDNNKLHITASVGIAVSDKKTTNIITLVQSADSALYAAKEEHRNCYKLFSEEMRHKDELHLNILNALSYALDNNEFYLCFQPVIDVESKKLVGAEALLRWESAELGFVGPDVFIEIAESSGRINDIGFWVLESACKTIANWKLQGVSIPTISINLSPVQLLSGDIPQIFNSLLRKYSLDATALALEITEGVLIGENDQLLKDLSLLKNTGSSLYLDDFGTGYSSLSYLNQYPFDFLKIDKSFISDLQFDIKHQALVQSVIAMANSLNLKVIAEGVETQWEVDFLTKNRCDRIQGYFYGKPVTADDFKSIWLFSGVSV